MCESLAKGGGIASFVSNMAYAQSDVNDVIIGLINQIPREYWVDIPERVRVVEFGKSQLGFSLKYPIRIYKYIRSVNPEIVHIHSSFLYYALSVLLLHRRVKFVYTIHSDAVQENASRWDRMFFWLKKMCFRLGLMHPVTISKESKRSFDNLYGMDSKLIVNGIKQPCRVSRIHKLDIYRYSPNTTIFYHPGRITKAKNQLVLCQAFQKLILEGKDVVLVISGTKQDPCIYTELEKYFSDRIVYLGERNDVIDLLSESDAMCLPSIWEGMPIVLLESLSVGCVPICSPVGGIPEVVEDGVNGILSESHELADYLVSLRKFISMSKLEIDKMRERALESFDKYKVEKTAEKYGDYYSYLLSKKI